MQPTLRVLEPSEFHQVAEMYAKVFTGPLPDNGWIVIAVWDGKIVGFSCLQQIWHAEPVWVDPEYRGSSLFSRLLSMVKTILPQKVKGVLISTDDSRMVNVLKLLGLEHVEALQTFRWLRR